MTQPSRKPLSSMMLLLALCAFAVLREFDLAAGATPLAGSILLIWAFLEWRQLATIAKITFAAALLMGIWFWLIDSLPQATLWKAIGRSAFFTFFVVAMDILRTAAMSSRMVLASGRTVVEQPPGRRYAMITLGGHLFAVLLNLGAINLLGAMNRRSIEAAADQDPRIKEIRLQRMTLALVRGFTAFTIWAPTSVTAFVVLSAIPELEWVDYAPIGLVLAVSYMLIGWLLDRWSHPRRALTGQPEPLLRVLRSLWPMTLLTIAILSAAALFAALGQIRLIAALLICVPLSGVIWIAVQYKRAGPTRALALAGRRMARRVLPDLVTLRSEVAILSAAGFIAVLLPEHIDTVALGQFIASLGLTEGWLLVGLLWGVALTAPIGLNPIISVSVSVEILYRLEGFSFAPHLLAMGGILAWALATGLSPLGATIRISGRSIDRPAAEVGLVWNRPFSLYILLIASAVVLLAS